MLLTGYTREGRAGGWQGVSSSMNYPSRFSMQNFTSLPSTITPRDFLCKISLGKGLPSAYPVDFTRGTLQRHLAPPLGMGSSHPYTALLGPSYEVLEKSTLMSPFYTTNDLFTLRCNISLDTILLMCYTIDT